MSATLTTRVRSTARSHPGAFLVAAGAAVGLAVSADAIQAAPAALSDPIGELRVLANHLRAGEPCEEHRLNIVAWAERIAARLGDERSDER